jgi:hypothetical protein
VEIAKKMFPNSNDPTSDLRSYRFKNKPAIEEERRRQRGEIV